MSNTYSLLNCFNCKICDCKSAYIHKILNHPALSSSLYHVKCSHCNSAYYLSEKELREQSLHQPKPSTSSDATSQNVNNLSKFNTPIFTECFQSTSQPTVTNLYEKGWVCPICNYVMSPNQKYCLRCAGELPKQLSRGDLT